MIDRNAAVLETVAFFQATRIEKAMNMPHSPRLSTDFSPADMARALEDAMQTPAPTRIDKQVPSVPWGPTLQFDTTHVYPALSESLERTATLGSSVSADSAARARVTTSGIPDHKAPLPKLRYFAPVGVAGGMGPLATVDLQKKLFEAGERKLNELAAQTGRQVTDQDHMGVISFNLGHMIQDRTAYIKSFKGDPDDPQAVREHLLKDVAENPFWGALHVCMALKNAGAHAIMFPCNTFHAWFDLLAEHVKLPMLHIAEATVLSLQQAKDELPENPQIGLIATTGTVDSRLYQAAGERMEKFGGPKITWRHPTPGTQDKAMRGIYDGVKAGDMPLGAALLNEVVLELIKDGVHAFVDGCTEVHPAIGDITYPVPQVDAATALAETAVRLSMVLARLERKFS